ncbi:M14 family zinc carboxypeptidase [Alkalihalophilus lindianensis]|uniref:M14 family zinc carboxypeptidase n=1 Tax=Alkalihalophilus lindianensis TaxID=1630542 RepID=A0ABU3XFD6_9BACI|nr:M14 family zinc carboxypeptidase [Alkalihalophilus lindianensis]MDV2686605.1 M14 family zinc carboxypeptidase [Alkalihalophilus lindianensis]
MKKLVMTLGTGFLAASLLMSPVQAAQNNTGPAVPNQQNLSISGFMTHEQMTKRLDQIATNSQGRVEVEVVGFSNQGREIYKATVGTGDRVILIESEIHGNEKTGTEALLNILQFLGSSNSPKAKQIRDEVTIVALPKMNPDSAELDRRANDMTWGEVVEAFPQLSEASSPAWNYYTRMLQGTNYAERPGFDVNRDFNPDLQYIPKPEDFPGNSASPGWFITPEAQTVRDVYVDLQNQFGKVDVFVDLHHQGPYMKVEGTDDDVTMSISGQFVPDPNTAAGAKYNEYADDYDYDFSRQLNVAVYDALQIGNSPFKNISLYQQGLDLPGTALGSFALNGSGTVLFEVRGQTQSFGQKMRGQLVKAVEDGLYGIIEGVADESVYEIDPEKYEEIPLTIR